MRFARICKRGLEAKQNLVNRNLIEGIQHSQAGQ